VTRERISTMVNKRCRQGTSSCAAVEDEADDEERSKSGEPWRRGTAATRHNLCASVEGEAVRLELKL
jgi:hypothetical protein